MLPKISKEKTSQYMTKQLGEMLSSSNRKLTKVRVGHSPTDDECMLNFALYGGSEDFERRWRQAHSSGG